MSAYFKGSASAILTALVVLFLIGNVDYQNYFLSFFLVISICGYLFGLFAALALFLIKKRKLSTLKSYLLFLFLGIGAGSILEVMADGFLFPKLIISTAFASCAFLAIQNVTRRSIVYPLSLIPLLVVGWVYAISYLN